MGSNLTSLEEKKSAYMFKHFNMTNKQNFRIDEENIFADKAAADTNLSNTVYLYDINLVKNKYPLINENYLDYRFDEFIINDYISSKAYRNNFLGDSKLCCALYNKYYYYNYNNNTIKLDTKSDDLYINLRTCFPSSKLINSSDYCDLYFADICVYEKTLSNVFNIEINSYFKKKCQTWIPFIFKRNIPDKQKYKDYIFKKCVNNIDDHCIIWLSSLIEMNDEEANNLHDDILIRQSKLYKLKNLKCSFPSVSVLLKEKYIVEPRICWDYNCSIEKNWQLLKKDISKKQECINYNCNVSFDYINIGKTSNVKISCNDKINNESINPIKKLHKELDIFNNLLGIFLNVDFFVFFIFGLLILYSLLVFFKYDLFKIPSKKC